VRVGKLAIFGCIRGVDVAIGDEIPRKVSVFFGSSDGTGSATYSEVEAKLMRG
jgi:hypothetical protein